MLSIVTISIYQFLANVSLYNHHNIYFHLSKEIVYIVCAPAGCLAGSGVWIMHFTDIFSSGDGDWKAAVNIIYHH